MVQVQRLAENGSLRGRDVQIPGTMVDCVVVAKPENHWMGYMLEYDPAAAGEIRRPPTSTILPLDERKLVARRGAYEIAPNDIVNLGIGMPRGVLPSFATRRPFLRNITLTTEPGIHGGAGLSGHNFGPRSQLRTPCCRCTCSSTSTTAGVWDVCFLGMAEVTQNGDVNVTRVGPKLTGARWLHRHLAVHTPRQHDGDVHAGGLKVDVKDGKLVILKGGQEQEVREEDPRDHVQRQRGCAPRPGCELHHGALRVSR